MYESTPQDCLDKGEPNKSEHLSKRDIGPDDAIFGWSVPETTNEMYKV